MEDNLQEIRREIELTRLALGEKVSRLEEKIQTTKNTTLNPAYHVRTRPWPALGSAVVAGFILGRKLKARAKAASTSRAAALNEPRVTGSVGSAAANAVGILAVDLLRDYFRRRRDRYDEDAR